MATIDLPSSSTETQDTRGIVTTKHKRWLVFKLCVIVIVTILSIAFLVANVVITAKNVQRKQELKDHIETSLKVSGFINFLQDERNITTSYLLRENVSRQTVTTDIRHLRNKWKFTFKGKNGAVIKDFQSLKKAIRRLRSEVRNKASQRHILHYFNVYTSWINVFISWPLVNGSQILADTNDLAAYNMIVKSREEFEMEKAFGAYFYYGGNLTLQNISQRRVRGEAFLETARLLSSAVDDTYLSLKEVNTSLWTKLEAKRQNIASNAPIKSSNKDLRESFNLMTKYCDLLVRLEDYEAQRISYNIKKNIKENITLLVLRSLLVCVALIIMPFFAISLVKSQNELYKYAHSLHDKVDLEQSRTEFLLRENARHMDGMAERWKQFSQQLNAENRDDQPGTSTRECWKCKK